MHKTLTILGTLLVAILLILGACGPTPASMPTTAPTTAPTTTPTPTDTLEPSTFELKKWEVIDDNGVAALQISFSATEDLEFVFTDPDGVQVDWEYTELGVTGARLWMADYGETPPAGQYTLLVKRYDELVDSIPFDFEGASLEIVNVDISWTYYHFEYIEDYYSLDGIQISVINHGDLPAYINEGKFRLNEETQDLYFFNGALLPGEEETFNPSVFMYEVAPGTYELRLELKDSTGQTLATYSAIVGPS